MFWYQIITNQFTLAERFKFQELADRTNYSEREKTLILITKSGNIQVELPF